MNEFIIFATIVLLYVCPAIYNWIHLRKLTKDKHSRVGVVFVTLCPVINLSIGMLMCAMNYSEKDRT